MDPVGLQTLLNGDDASGRKLYSSDPAVLVGPGTSDDAGVYRMSADQALVQTVDFITPPLDDPRAFGRIAAANSLSDVWAMGGTPITALNLVCFPSELPVEMLRDILRGGAEKAAEAQTAIVGGHTIRDKEPKYGLSVTGIVHPDRIWRNRGARAGDRLLLTKAVGTGVLFNANRKEPLAEDVLRALQASAERLNRYAALALIREDIPIHAVTDITGFGLAGHAAEMVGRMRIHLDMDALPALPGARDAYRRGVSTGANRSNRIYAGATLEILSSGEEPAHDHLQLAFDPQTSGGLLIAVPEHAAERALQIVREAGDEIAALVGSVHESDPGGSPGITLCFAEPRSEETHTP